MAGLYGNSTPIPLNRTINFLRSGRCHFNCPTSWHNKKFVDRFQLLYVLEVIYPKIRKLRNTVVSLQHQEKRCFIPPVNYKPYFVSNPAWFYQEKDCSGLPISIPHAPKEMKPMTPFRWRTPSSFCPLSTLCHYVLLFMYELSATLCRYVILSENIEIVVPSVPSVSLCHYVHLSENIKISNRSELSVSSCHYVILSENI